MLHPAAYTTKLKAVILYISALSAVAKDFTVNHLALFINCYCDD